MKIDFEFTTPYGVFRDALHLQDDHTLTEEQVQELKQQRLTNWIAVLEAPPAEVLQEIVAVSTTIEIDGEVYQKLEGVPQSGAKLIEANGTWYYKVQEIVVVSTTIEIDGEVYQKLEGVPQSGAKLIEANGTWYYKVQ